MRTIVCRFKDEAEFFHHLGDRAGAGRPVLTFLGDFELRPGQELDVAVLVSSSRERCRLKMRVSEGRALAHDGNTGVGIGTARGGTRGVWSYTAAVAADDAVWLDAFVARLSTRQKLAA